MNKSSIDNTNELTLPRVDVKHNNFDKSFSETKKSFLGFTHKDLNK